MREAKDQALESQHFLFAREHAWLCRDLSRRRSPLLYQGRSGCDSLVYFRKHRSRLGFTCASGKYLLTATGGALVCSANVGSCARPWLPDQGSAFGRSATAEIAHAARESLCDPPRSRRLDLRSEGAASDTSSMVKKKARREASFIFDHGWVTCW